MRGVLLLLIAAASPSSCCCCQAAFSSVVTAPYSIRSCSRVQLLRTRRSHSGSERYSSSSNHAESSNLDRAAAQAALERTAAHLEKLQKQQQRQRQPTNTNTKNNASRNGRRRSSAGTRLPFSEEEQQPQQEANSLLVDDEPSSEYEDDSDGDDDDTIDHSNDNLDPLGDERERLFREYRQWPANALKVELKTRQLPVRGRKPDLAQRLAQDDLRLKYGRVPTGKGDDDDDDDDEADGFSLWKNDGEHDLQQPRTITHFAGLFLSPAPAQALTRARFTTPSPIQQAAIPFLASKQQQQRHSPRLHGLGQDAGLSVARHGIPVASQSGRQY